MELADALAGAVVTQEGAKALMFEGLQREFLSGLSLVPPIKGSGGFHAAGQLRFQDGIDSITKSASLASREFG